MNMFCLINWNGTKKIQCACYIPIDAFIHVAVSAKPTSINITH